MKYFNNFTQLSQARLVDNTPVTILEPTAIEGVVRTTGDGLTLPNGLVLVMKFDDIESLTKRRTQLLADEFLGNLSARLNTYKKDTDGTWVAAPDSLTSTVFYAGSLWWPQKEEEYSPIDHQIVSWSKPSEDTLEVRTLDDRYFVFERYVGLGQTPISPDQIDADNLVVNDGTTEETLSVRFSKLQESDQFFKETNGVNLQDITVGLELKKWILNEVNGAPEADPSGHFPVLRTGRYYWNPLSPTTSDLVYTVVSWAHDGQELNIVASDDDTGDQFDIKYVRRLNIGYDQSAGEDADFIVAKP